MTNQSPPMGRMLRRAIPEEYNLHNTGSLWNWFYRDISNDECTLVRWRSLNTTAKQRQQIRAKHLEEIYTRSLIHFPDNPLRPAEYCKRLGMGIIDFVELPYTYLQAAHYFNNFKPRL